jgi:serpin B
MVLVLPRERDGLAEVSAALDAERLAGLLEGASPTRVALSLPRFRVESRCALRGPLEALGLETAFRSGLADLSGFAGEPGELFVDEVLHQAFVAVDEQGAEAAAATAVLTGVRSAPAGAPVVFRADHPFLFAIRHAETGQALFLGRVSDPTESP